jgi:hypothetical protein
MSSEGDLLWDFISNIPEKKGEFKDLILNSYHRQCNSYGQYAPIILNKQNTLITIILQMAYVLKYLILYDTSIICIKSCFLKFNH